MRRRDHTRNVKVKQLHEGIGDTFGSVGMTMGVLNTVSKSFSAPAIAAALTIYTAVSLRSFPTAGDFEQDEFLAEKSSRTRSDDLDEIHGDRSSSVHEITYILCPWWRQNQRSIAGIFDLDDLSRPHSWR